LLRWLAALPAGLVSSRPRLCLAQAFMARAGGDIDAIEAPLEAAERASADAADEPYEPSVDRGASLVANVPAAIALHRAGLAHLRGDAEQTTAFARQARAELSHGEWMLESVAQWSLAVAEWLDGRLPQAEQALASGIAHWRAADPRTIFTAWGYHYLGQVQQARGRLGAALGTYQQALHAAGEPGRPALQTAGIATCRQFAYTLPLATGLAVLAWIRQAKGDRVGAMDALAEAERVQLSPAVVGLLNPVPTLRALLALANGAVSDAARWVQGRGLSEDDQPDYPREREYLVLTRVLLGQHDPDRALALLQRLQALAVAQGRTGSLIEIRALQGLGLAAADDESAALAALEEALAVAAPEGYVRVFVDQGAPMASLLGKLATDIANGRTGGAERLPPAYLRRLVHAFTQAGLPVLSRPTRGGVAVPGLVVPPTARELEVLALLADGRSNQAIAEELVITLDTVKRHVSHLLDKLGAANRTQAVTRARELGLLR
jgi:ATP/maltotriose-dependent transcriptional regulator MalT